MDRSRRFRKALGLVHATPSADRRYGRRVAMMKRAQRVRSVYAQRCRADVVDGREVTFFVPDGDEWRAAGTAEVVRGDVRNFRGLALPMACVQALVAKIEEAA